MRREPDEGERELGAWLATKRAEEEAALAEAAAELTRHRLFMEAAAVETLAVAMASAGERQWGNLRLDQQDQWRSAARRLITESMETRHDG